MFVAVDLLLSTALLIDQGTVDVNKYGHLYVCFFAFPDIFIKLADRSSTGSNYIFGSLVMVLDMRAERGTRFLLPCQWKYWHWIREPVFKII